MQILLKNGGKTPEFECDFKETAVVYYPDDRIEYSISENDVNSVFRCSANLAYEAEHGRVDVSLLEYVLHFEHSQPYLTVRNKVSGQYIQRRMLLTMFEMGILEHKTFRMFGAT